MDNKSVYFPVSWDDAADYSRALDALGIPYAVEDPTEGLPLSQGQLAIVLPHMPARQYKKVVSLFHGEGEHYPR